MNKKNRESWNFIAKSVYDKINFVLKNIIHAGDLKLWLYSY